MKISIKDVIKIFFKKRVVFVNFYYNSKGYNIKIETVIEKIYNNSIMVKQNILCKKEKNIISKVNTWSEYKNIKQLKNNIFISINVDVCIYHTNGKIKKNFNKTSFHNKLCHYDYLINKDEYGNLHGLYKTNDLLSDNSNGLYIHGVKCGLHIKNTEYTLYKNGKIIEYVHFFHSVSCAPRIEFFISNIWFDGVHAIRVSSYESRYECCADKISLSQLSEDELNKIFAWIKLHCCNDINYNDNMYILKHTILYDMYFNQKLLCKNISSVPITLMNKTFNIK